MSKSKDVTNPFGDLLREASPYFFHHDSKGASLIYQLRDAWTADFLEVKEGIGYRAGIFLKSLAGDPAAARKMRELGIPMVKAEATQPNAAGGVLVPTEFADAILILLEKFGVVRANAGIWPMNRDQLVIPRSAATAWTVNWSSENIVASFSQAALDAVTLSAKKLSAYLKISEELFEDATAALGFFFLTGLAQAFAKVEDTAAFIGDGTSAYGGVRGISATLSDGNHTAGKIVAQSGHTTFGTLDATDIAAAIGAVPARAMANMKIYISTVGYGNTLVRLAASSGALVAAVDQNGQLHATWAGIPIVFTQALPVVTTTLANQMLLAVGDLAQGIQFGVRRDLAIRAFHETYADQDQVFVRATERLDIVASDLGDNTNAGAIVGLFAPGS